MKKELTSYEIEELYKRLNVVQDKGAQTQLSKFVGIYDQKDTCATNISNNVKVKINF